MNKHYCLSALILVSAILIYSIPALLAQAPDASGVPAHTVVTVEAHRGSVPPTIERADVMVYEGRDRDKVTDWVPAQGDQAGLEFFVLLDDSAGESLGNQLDEIRRFINGQPASTRVGIAYMQNGTARIEQNLTDDHARAAKALRLPMGIGGGNGGPYFALSDLIKRWPATSSRREVLIVSDGIDTYYGGGDLQDPYLASAIGDAQRAGIVVSAIYSPGSGHFGHSYWQTYWGQLYLAQLTDKTGGESYDIGFTGAPVSFAPYLNNLADRLKHQYLLTFLAKPANKPGLRRVRITTEVPNADLVSAGDVYVPAGR